MANESSSLDHPLQFLPQVPFPSSAVAPHRSPSNCTSVRPLAPMSCNSSHVPAAPDPTTDPPRPNPIVPHHDNTATLDFERKKLERDQRRKHEVEMKAARAREYEARWHANCAQDMSEDLFASGWKQPPMRADGFGGWEYASIHVEANSAALPQYPSWKRNLHPQHLDRRYGGWDQYPSSSSEDTALGGWLYSDPSDQLGDFQKEVEILGKKVMVTVASKGATVEKWLEVRKEEVKWGLDIEWRPTFQKGDYHNAALLQLSLEECCLLVQLRFIDMLPASLKSLLANPNIKMGGVGILADTKKLKKDYGLICAGEVELTTLAVSTLKNTSLKKSGIATLTEKVLGVPYEKNKRVTMSNWENRDLTYAQIHYAAADAWLSYSIMMALLNYKEMPPSALSLETTPGRTASDVGENLVSVEDAGPLLQP